MQEKEKDRILVYKSNQYDAIEQKIRQEAQLAIWQKSTAVANQQLKF